MENKIECFIASLDGYVFIIPVELQEKFEGTSYYDRRDAFAAYILPDDVIFDSIYIDEYDVQCLIDGDLE